MTPFLISTTYFWSDLRSKIWAYLKTWNWCSVIYIWFSPNVSSTIKSAILESTIPEKVECFVLDYECFIPLGRFLGPNSYSSWSCIIACGPHIYMHSHRRKIFWNSCLVAFKGDEPCTNSRQCIHVIPFYPHCVASGMFKVSVCIRTPVLLWITFCGFVCFGLLW